MDNNSQKQDKKFFGMYLDIRQYEKIKEFARSYGMPMSTYVRFVLSEHIRKQSRKKG